MSHHGLYWIIEKNIEDLSVSEDEANKARIEEATRLADAAEARFRSMVTSFGGGPQRPEDRTSTAGGKPHYTGGVLDRLTEKPGGLTTDDYKFLSSKGSAKDVLDSLKDYEDLRLKQFEMEYQYAKQLEQVWKGIGQQAQGLQDSVRLQTRGGRYAIDILNRDYAKLQGLVAKAGDDPGKIQEALSLAEKVFGELGQVYLPGSSSYQQIASFIDNYSQKVQDKAGQKEVEAQRMQEAAKTNAQAFRDSMLPIIGTFEGLAKWEFEQQKQTLVDLLGVDSVLVTAVTNITAALDDDPNTKVRALPSPTPVPTDAQKYPGVVPEGAELYGDTDTGFSRGAYTYYTYSQGGNAYSRLIDGSGHIANTIQITQDWTELVKGTWARILDQGAIRFWHGPNPPDEAGGKDQEGEYGPLLSSPTARAFGGVADAMRPYLVGEHGPELFTPMTDGYVHRNDSSATQGALGNVNVTVAGPDITLQNATIEQVADAMEYLCRTKQRSTLIAALREAVRV